MKIKDKQLATVKLADMIQKRKLDQALNAKEFARLAGISYSTAREWFRQPGFPLIRGCVFWSDFVLWRQAQCGLTALLEQARRPSTSQPQEYGPTPKSSPPEPRFNGKVAALLRLAG